MADRAALPDHAFDVRSRDMPRRFRLRGLVFSFASFDHQVAPSSPGSVERTDEAELAPTGWAS